MNGTIKSFINPPFKNLEDIKNLKVTVMGLGLNGGGVASAAFFAANGTKVTVTDMKTEAELASSMEKLRDYNIRYVLGKHEVCDFENADLVIKNPGIKIDNNIYLEKAKSIETDISVFLRLSEAKVIAVTGSKGKSSTVSCIYWGLKEAGKKVFLGGNITVSPLTFLSETTKDSIVVLELSSWQLADLKGRGILKPETALITPVMPDHQNWYGSMEAYVEDKKLIYKDMGENSVLICNYDDGWGKIFAEEAGKLHCRVKWYTGKKPSSPEKFEGVWLNKKGEGFINIQGKKIKILPKKVLVPGKHQKQNLLNSALVMYFQGVPLNKIPEILKRFPGIEHRLEFFFEKKGVKFYNDSAATIPEASAAALEAFSKPPVLLAGGTDKNLDFTPLAKNAKKAKHIFLLEGSGTEKLIKMLKKRKIKFHGPYSNLDSMIMDCYKKAKKGDIVVFSPGATSFGMFKNEFHRGNEFKSRVRALLDGHTEQD